ncbi:MULTISPECIES: GAF and ANTAR domain-containing protein [unclassified Streptomyces]|uniref:GAF and ANTAR domain-containing protein n=1 Tax=unclassified Streptomyces TaxID=2593676 RepID=UPI000DC76C50|nr:MULTISPECIES: GAF and ANTAR domain-containing protein [unclassified Streptomyces]AWZ09182.1 diguanylate cyclase [Streptomyces sp. ICC4]AWZ16549.1 diguanylate cyclase [Streptomyces sp. ICC1]
MGDPSAFPDGGGPPFGQDDLKWLSQALADSLAGTPGIDTPAALCRACVDLLDVTGASVSLGGDSDDHTLWWSSDPVAGQLAEAQYTLGDGPGRIARALAAPVLAADLTGGTDARRWPIFAQQAVALGVRAVFSLPLGLPGLAVGTLDLYRDRPGPLSERDRSFAFPAADAITTALLALQAQEPPGDGATWLDAAELDHDEVHQATGMIMVHIDRDIPQALARLRAHAFTQGQSITEAARDVLAGRVRFDD